MLRRNRASDDTIDALRDAFCDPPAGVAQLPCPCCFARGRSERLETLAFTGRLHALRCRLCQATIVVETGV